MIDGDTWVVGTTVYVNDSGNIQPLAVSGPVFDGTGIVVGTGIAQAGDYAWNHAEGLLYKYDGISWLRWGKGRNWLADARGHRQGDDRHARRHADADPTPGDMFICPADGVVYIYNGIDAGRRRR
jgi:hypothetical protein